MTTFLDTHRGPFLFCVVRPHIRKKGHMSSEFLGGLVESTDVEAETRALLADPRDTISSVWVWSEKEQMFVGGFK